MRLILKTARAEVWLVDGEYYVYAGTKLERVVPSVGMAHEVAASL